MPDTLPIRLAPKGTRLTPAQWQKIESFLDEWKREVLAAARTHPAKSYRLGHAQIKAFADLLGNLQGAAPTATMFGGVSPTMREAEGWAQRYLLHELDDALNVFVGKIKDELLYGLRAAENPTVVASRLHNAIGDATVNWRMIARTEMVRANAAGRLKACADMGYEQVWCPPHVGACESCKRLLEGQVFNIADVLEATNYGRAEHDWLPCIPLHPHCRHSWLPYDPDVYGEAQRQYAAMEAAGLTDEDRLDDMFDSSGQLRPEFADVDFSTAKRMDPFGEMLAAVVWKVHGPPAPPERYGSERLPLGEIRSDLYQRAVDPEKVLAMHRQLRLGKPLPPPKLARREDGTMWVVDGQHRIEARRLNGETDIDALIRPSMGWGQEAEECRTLIGKVFSSLAGLDLLKDTVDEGPVLEPTMEATLLAMLGPDPEVEPEPEPGLDPAVFDGLRLRDDVALRLEDWWGRVAGRDWPSWSRLYVRGHGGPVRILVDYPALRKARPEWAKLADGDLHLALVIAARQAAQGAELAPGHLLDLRIAPDQRTINEDRDRTERMQAGGPWETAHWSLANQTWMGMVPVGVEKSMADVHPAYVWVRGASINPAREAGRLLDSDEYEAQVAKAAAAQAPNAGVEHWITIHPNGPEEKGQPVLVRNNADGTMTVMGGAGGNLNMLRLDPARRVDDPSKAKGTKAIEQHVTAAESAESEAQREQEVTSAREQLAKLTDVRKQHTEDLHRFIGDELGLKLPDDHAARRKMLAKIRTSAMRTLAYGEVQARDTQDMATQGELGIGEDGVGEGTGRPLEPDEPADSSKKEEFERTPRPQIAQTADQARAILDRFLDLAQLGKAASAHRKVVNGESSGSDANQIDWTATADEKSKRRASQVEQTVRTDLARTLLEHGDRQYKGTKGGYDQRYKQAFQQGGYDTLDAFGHSILGASPVTKEAQKLLGVAGAAQLVAWHLQSEAAKKGKEGFDLKKVQAALKELTDEQEAAVNDRGLARVQMAMGRAAQAQVELAASEQGHSLYTTTMARSIASEKVQEAKRGLGMMIGGLEASSALKVALDRQAGEKIKVGGFSTPAQIKELAEKAHVKIGLGDIKRIGAGNYTLSLAPDRLAGLLKPPKPVNQAYRDQLEQIRTGKGLDEAIQAARTGPGMSDVLDTNQARGKMFLQTAGSGVLAFDPGVGKTHTAIAAAMEQMAADPSKKALIVAPTNMLRSWRDTIASQGSGKSIQMVGESRANPDKDTSDTATRIGQLKGGAHFTIVSYESLSSYQKHLRGLGEDTPSIVISDELQKAKNEKTGLHKGVELAVDAGLAQHGAGNVNFWGLTGTPVEKDVGDVHSMIKLAAKAKGKPMEDRKTFAARFGRLGQDEHIARGDKVRQFRKENMDEDLFRLTAQDAGNDLGKPSRTHHAVTLDDDHKAAMQATVNGVNQQIASYHQRKAEGTLREGEKPIQFGGRAALMDSLYGREDSQLGKSVADEIEKTGTFEHKGGKYTLPDGSPDPEDHAGTYEHKHVVFGSKETSRALFGRNWNAPGNQTPGGLHAELARRGMKVFIGHGSMSSAQNEANYKAFLAHPGKAVFLSNDKNNAGISLQFGDNKGAFQHGATHMHHFTRPVNNATIQQREARILRKGAQAGATYHTYSADTPIEQRLQETLDRELRTQDLAANSEQQVAGSDTLSHHLASRGIKPEKRAADARSR